RPWSALETMARPLDPVSALLKLVDACDQCALIFRSADEYNNTDAFGVLCSELRETLARFGFELQTEVRRIEDCDFGPLRPRNSGADEEPFQARCEIALRTTVREYESIQAGNMPAHARAMIQRQSVALRQLWDRFDQFQTPGRLDAENVVAAVHVDH